MRVVLGAHSTPPQTIRPILFLCIVIGELLPKIPLRICGNGTQAQPSPQEISIPPQQPPIIENLGAERMPEIPPISAHGFQVQFKPWRVLSSALFIVGITLSMRAQGILGSGAAMNMIARHILISVEFLREAGGFSSSCCREIITAPLREPVWQGPAGKNLPGGRGDDKASSPLPAPTLCPCGASSITALVTHATTIRPDTPRGKRCPSATLAAALTFRPGAALWHIRPPWRRLPVRLAMRRMRRFPARPAKCAISGRFPALSYILKMRRGLRFPPAPL